MNSNVDNPDSFEIVVHVGDGKTGTSSIQKTLRQHPGELAEAGIHYLGLMLERSATHKYDWQHAARIEAFHALEPGRATTELTDALQISVASAKRAGIRCLLLSNETLLGRSLPTIAALQQLRDEGIRITVVAYVRRHDGWARSAYLQWGLKHKTYEGSLRDFGQWAGKRKFALYPKLQRWHAAFGERLLVRNFDAVDDAAADFLSVLQLDPSRFVIARRNEALSAEELALRALFNQQSPCRVPPARFTQLFGSEAVDFSLPLERWLRDKLPTSTQLEAIMEGCADDRAQVNALLAENAQPPLATDALRNPPPSLDRDAMLAALFQLVAQQALRLEQLEKDVQGTMATVQAQNDGNAGAQVRPLGDGPDPDVATSLAPALGYFGPLAADCLELPGEASVREIRLHLVEAKPTFLNLRGLELLRQGKPLELAPGQHEATQSTVAGGDANNGPATLLTLKGIHSAAERDPWWQVKFSEPVKIDAMRLFNRGDGWNSRSRTLRVEILDSNGQVHCLHDGQSSGQLLKAYAATARLAGVAAPEAWPTTVLAAAETRRELLSKIARRLRDGSLQLKAIDWRLLVQMLGIWSDQEPDADEWTVIAALLLAQQQGKGGTSIKTFSLMLNTQTRLLRLQREINALAQALGLGGFMLTRHGLKPEGVLRREPERFLAHLETVIAALRALGREPMLAYGTLLGAVREGDFIAHDDDIDLLYQSDAGNRADVESEMQVLKEALKLRGFRVVDLLPNSLNMHVIDPKNGAVMDVFPCWQEDGSMQMHMESMKVRGIDPAIIHPLGVVALCGRQLPAPARPAAYLEERYGPGWQVSDQFFEWPWPLREEAAR